MEPHKCGSWDWYNLNNLPSPLWHTLDKVLCVLKEKIL